MKLFESYKIKYLQGLSPVYTSERKPALSLVPSLIDLEQKSIKEERKS